MPALKPHDGSEALPLLSFAALHGPDAALRRRLRTGLERWAKGMAPAETKTDALRSLKSCTGTPIEPFELDEDEAWLAQLLVRIVRGGAAGIPAVRIQGHDNLGTEGGLVVQNGGNPRFSERLATGAHVKAPGGTLVLRPGHVMDPAELRLQRTAACRLEHSTKGMAIYLEPTPRDGKLRLLGEPPKATPGEPLGIRGLDIRASQRDGALTIRARSPEVILRLSAFLAGDPVVAVHAPEDNGRYALLVRFTSQDAEAHPLPAVSSRPLRALERWLEPRSEIALPSDFPSHADRVALSEWLAPPTPWLTEKLLEELL